MKATIIEINTALRIRANCDYTDSRGNNRLAGEELLIRDQGPYIPSAEETIVDPICATLLSDTNALRLEAIVAFTDIYGIKRRAGEEWIVTNKLSSTHIRDVNEKYREEISKIILNRWQYCIVVDPVIEGKTLFGRKELRKGECSFFLNPGENLLEGKCFDVQLLGEDEALLLIAREEYTDEYGTHLPGERWMVKGPRNYIPDVEVQILERRKSIPLDDNEGIYVRDIHTGEVRMVTGETYLLKAHEVE